MLTPTDWFVPPVQWWPPQEPDQAPHGSLFEYSATPFVLHSGQESHWRINAEELPPSSLQTIAAMIRDTYNDARRAIHHVTGIPRGGLDLADLLMTDPSFVVPHTPDTQYNELIVDDVLTTGASMDAMIRERAASLRLVHGNNFMLYGYVIFARAYTEHEFLDVEVRALFWHEAVVTKLLNVVVS